MTFKLLAAIALSLGLGTAVALAQTDPIQPETGATTDSGATLPPGWEGALGDAFFSDPTTGTLRSQDEVQANWQNLTEEQQAQVRAHCETTATAGADTGAAADDEVTTGSTTPDGTNVVAMQQICEWVDAM